MKNSTKKQSDTHFLKVLRSKKVMKHVFDEDTVALEDAIESESESIENDLDRRRAQRSAGQHAMFMRSMAGVPWRFRLEYFKEVAVDHLKKEKSITGFCKLVIAGIVLFIIFVFIGRKKE